MDITTAKIAWLPEARQRCFHVKPGTQETDVFSSMEAMPNDQESHRRIGPKMHGDKTRPKSSLPTFLVPTMIALENEDRRRRGSAHAMCPLPRQRPRGISCYSRSPASSGIAMRGEHSRGATDAQRRPQKRTSQRREQQAHLAATRIVFKSQRFACFSKGRGFKPA